MQLLKFDGKLAISIGKSRTATKWLNKPVLWSDLLDKFSTVHRTDETYADYISFTKDKQDEKKDVGGFVAGHILNGRRKNGNILFRTCVTLDVDFGTADLWDDFTFNFDYAAALYTTHKHSPETPRYRVVLPLDREVMADEYEAIARRIAGWLDIDIFDPTTFQPARLMYWPSASSDGVFEFKYQDGPAVCADKILASYRDWRDVSQWPVCRREKEAAAHRAKKQGDPTEKAGLIGAFCRTYNIIEAIDKFLSDTYEPTDSPDRYTYIHGSTAKGLVIYDDLYAYSHHGTDPAGGVLCNAFDLVRLHKFGHEDDHTPNGTPTSKLPSFKSMSEFISKDGPTRKTIGVEKIVEAQDDFADMGMSNEDAPAVTEVETEPDLSWLEKLDVDKNGQAKQTIYNVVLILENDTRLNKCFAYDVFRKRKCIMHNLPWRKYDPNGDYLRDEDESALRLYLERTYGITGRLIIADGLDNHIFKRSFHPVRDYLDGVEWDGKPRLDKLLIRYMGAEDTPYIRAVTRKTMVAAVARIYNPGVKFDYVLTLAGVEGKGKSTLIRKLGGRWFSDNFNTVLGKEAMEQIQGCWLIEMGEMAALKRAEVFAVKSFVSKQEDNYRPAYGHNTVYSPRQCVFFATTNESEFLRGVDGNRRFWIVDIHGRKAEADILIDTSLAEKERAQLWAEAKYYYEEGEPLRLDDELEAYAREEQKAHSEQDDRAGIIKEYLDMLLPDNWNDLNVYERQAYIDGRDSLAPDGVEQRNRVCAVEIWTEALRLNVKDLNPYTAKPIHDIMRSLPGWSESKTKLRFGKYGSQKAYVRVKNLVNG